VSTSGLDSIADPILSACIFQAAAVALTPLRFEMAQVAGFRYRAESVLHKLKPAVVREARVEGLRKELLNSQKLKDHFAAKPSDLLALQHQAPLSQAKVDQTLKHVPSYMVPKAMLKNPNGVIGQARKALGGQGSLAAKGRGGGGRGRGRGRGRGQAKRRDPLKNFGKR
jgi:ATP-dependent RNA helicase DDX56/DBP9